MQILVTGASGFIGSRCLERLIQSGVEGVHAVTSRTTLDDGHVWKDNCVWHVADLKDERSVEELVRQIRPTHLLHLAWETNSKDYWHAESNWIWASSTLAMLRQFLVCGGQRFVGVGSCAEYDWTYGCCVEGETPYLAKSPYSMSKAEVREGVKQLADTSSFSWAWAHVFWAYGSGQPEGKLIPDLIQSSLNNQRFQTTAGMQLRDYIFVEDVVDALLGLLFSEMIGCVNIGTGKEVSIRSIVSEVSNQLGSSHLIERLPDITNEERLVVADIRRLCSLGWTSKYSLAQGISETIEWSRNQFNARQRGVK